MRRRLLPTGLVGITAATMVASGCASDVHGAATPSPTSAQTTWIPGTSSSAKSGRETAPEVTNPLDASRFVTAPCAALGNTDLTSLGLAGARSESISTAGASGCQWQTNSVADGISWITPQKSGLSSVYAKKSELEYFRPTTVAGHPAVYAAIADLRSGGTCQLDVAVNNGLYFAVQWQMDDTGNASTNATRSCAAAKQTATVVIENVKGSR
ncbi:MAG: DUF3558 domain-containing protein [Sciscionella sp.]